MATYVFSRALSLADVTCSVMGMVRFAAAEAIASEIDTDSLEQRRLQDRRVRDARWVAAVGVGNEEAFAEVFHEFYSVMLRAARLRLPTRDDAEEVVQQVFMNVWRMRVSWKPRESVGAYLLGALRLQIVFANRTDARRRRALSRLAVTSDARRLLARPVETDECLMESELSRDAERAIAALSERLRETFILAKEGKLTTEELADYLGVTPAAVRMNLKRAYRVLRVRLADYV